MKAPGAAEPTLSIVIAASDSANALARSIASLPSDAEVIVVAASDRIVRPSRLENVEWIEAAPGSGVPRLRRLGLDRARGDVVILTEDSCVFGAGWADGFQAAFNNPATLAATGPIAPAMGDGLIDWAVFFCEYAPFVRPSSPPTRLAGNNFTVRRTIAAALDPNVIEESEIFACLHRFESQARLVPSGEWDRSDASASKVATNIKSPVLLSPASTAYHTRRYTLAEAIRDRLRFGRDYGRRRAGSMPKLHRLMGFVIGPLVWLVQAARLLATVIRSRSHLGPFARSLPVTLGLLTAWSVGEWLGWMRAAVTPMSSGRPHERVDPPHEPATVPAESSRRRYRPARSTF